MKRFGNCAVILLSGLIVLWSDAVHAITPVAINSSYSWNLATAGVMIQAAGMDPARWFYNVDNTTLYSLNPPNPGWCVLDLSNFSTLGRVRLVRNILPEMQNPQSFFAQLVASNTDGQASLDIYGWLPAPFRPAMYPATNASAPLAAQSTPQSDVWFTDLFPPQTFTNVGTYAGETNVLQLGLGAGGQPANRVANFNNASLVNATFNKQGRRYSIGQSIPTGTGLTVTASVFIPSSWLDSAPGSPSCADGPACARSAWFEVELGSSYATYPTITPVFTARMGFDSRFDNLSGTNNYVFATLGGPLLEQPHNPATFPYSPLGTLLIDAPGKHVKPVQGWANVLQKNAWNNFSLTLQHFPYDTLTISNVPRNCKETMRIEWFLNGHRTFLPDSGVAVTVEPCVKDVDGSLVSTSINAVRDIIVSGWTVPQNVSDNLVVGYSSFWSGMNVYNATFNPPTITLSPPPPPPLLPPPPPPSSTPSPPPASNDAPLPGPPPSTSPPATSPSPNAYPPGIQLQAPPPPELSPPPPKQSPPPPLAPKQSPPPPLAPEQLPPPPLLSPSPPFPMQVPLADTPPPPPDPLPPLPTPSPPLAFNPGTPPQAYSPIPGSDYVLFPGAPPSQMDYNGLPPTPLQWQPSETPPSLQPPPPESTVPSSPQRTSQGPSYLYYYYSEPPSSLLRSPSPPPPSPPAPPSPLPPSPSTGGTQPISNYPVHGPFQPNLTTTYPPVAASPSPIDSTTSPAMSVPPMPLQDPSPTATDKAPPPSYKNEACKKKKPQSLIMQKP